jgi:hypothetical protein
VLALQHLDDDADVVEDAEAGGMGAPCVMEPGDRNEAAARATGTDADNIFLVKLSYWWNP